MAQLMENAEVADNLIQGKPDEDGFKARRKEPQGKQFSGKDNVTSRQPQKMFSKLLSGPHLVQGCIPAHMGIETPLTFRAIQTELKKQGLVSISNSSTALLVVAGNDYTAYGLLHPNKEGLIAFIGKVVSEVVASLEVLHGLGFRRLAVTNLEPFGCFPAVTHLSNYTSCNKSENQESGFHNKLLESHILKLKAKLPTTDISILDLERAFSLSLGGTFNHSRSQWKSCCRPKKNGGCGLVNTKGKPLYSVCTKPRKAFYWDAVHPTDSGWKSVSKILFSVKSVE
ncbi:hypothetical protein L7F22_050537 [Adiantum nelumboides]|nr:hypothetical protein [Adiantum nelumboides]